MKKLTSYAVLGVCALIFGVTSCKKDSNNPQPGEPATSASVTLVMENEVDGAPVVLGGIKYTNLAGNEFGVDLLKYYVTNVILVNENGSEYKAGNYDLVDASVTGSGNISLGNVPNGKYTFLRFLIGVDSARNHNGAQDGALDPIHGMIWTWNTGYIFLKHEGSYKNSNGETKQLAFHFGSDRARTAIMLPVAMEVKGVQKKIVVKFNLNELYKTPYTIDFNVDNNHQSSGTPPELLWVDKTQSNMMDAFTLHKIE